ncbi:MAG TPA: ATP-binding protein, partial [Thermoleophilaceae bacterium]
MDSLLFALHQQARTTTYVDAPSAGCEDSTAMTSRVSSAGFVGRAAELAELEAALRDAGASRPSLAFVAGESGVGKSRLADELIHRARATGVRVLAGECVDLGSGELPYSPLIGALRPLARDRDPVLELLPEHVRADLATLLPGLGP